MCQRHPLERRRRWLAEGFGSEVNSRVQQSPSISRPCTARVCLLPSFTCDIPSTPPPSGKGPCMGGRGLFRRFRVALGCPIVDLALLGIRGSITTLSHHFPCAYILLNSNTMVFHVLSLSGRVCRYQKFYPIPIPILWQSCLTIPIPILGKCS